MVLVFLVPKVEEVSAIGACGVISVQIAYSHTQRKHGVLRRIKETKVGSFWFTVCCSTLPQIICARWRNWYIVTPKKGPIGFELHLQQVTLASANT